jgi:hypothetical protein
MRSSWRSSGARCRSGCFGQRDVDHLSTPLQAWCVPATFPHMHHLGTRRTRRHFSELEAMALLRAFGEARRACRRAMASAPIGGEPYRAASAVMDAIDAAGEILTGRAKPWTPRPHGGLEDGQPQAAPGEANAPGRDPQGAAGRAVRVVCKGIGGRTTICRSLRRT